MRPEAPVQPSTPGPEEGAALEARWEDLGAALLFLLIGLGAFIIALDYPAGTMRRMGPGFFTLLVSGLLVAIGVVLGLQALAGNTRAFLRTRSPFRPQAATLRALLFIMLSLAAFAVLVRPAGLFPATAILMFIATQAERGRGLLGSLFISLAGACVASLIFVYGIGLPMPLWP